MSAVTGNQSPIRRMNEMRPVEADRNGDKRVVERELI
jgi:hypothetical protein